jgi:hypothetical protein
LFQLKVRFRSLLSHFFLVWRKMAIFVEYPNILWKKFLDRISCLVSPNNDISTICCRLVIRSPPTFSTLSLCSFFTSLFPCTRIEWAQPPVTLSSTLMRLDTQWHQNGWFNQCPLLLLNAHDARMTNQKIPTTTSSFRSAWRIEIFFADCFLVPRRPPVLIFIRDLCCRRHFNYVAVSRFECQLLPRMAWNSFPCLRRQLVVFGVNRCSWARAVYGWPFSSWAHLIVKEAKLDSGKCKYAKEKHGS